MPRKLAGRSSVGPTPTLRLRLDAQDGEREHHHHQPPGTLIYIPCHFPLEQHPPPTPPGGDHYSITRPEDFHCRHHRQKQLLSSTSISMMSKQASKLVRNSTEVKHATAATQRTTLGSLLRFYRPLLAFCMCRQTDRQTDCIMLETICPVIDTYVHVHVHVFYIQVGR